MAAFDDLLQAEGQAPLLAAPYILDIDLDYFNTFASTTPSDKSALQELAKGASLITIATEPGHVRACSLDGGLTSELLLPKVVELLASAK